MKAFAAVLMLATVAGCASYQPVPAGYAGDTAVLADSGMSEDGSKAQLYVVVAIDGREVDNSVAASAKASYGQGFRLNTRIVDRSVPARPMKVLIKATHTTGAPIQALFGQAAGTFLSVQGLVDFMPKPGGRYVVTGELKKEGSSVWIEDFETNLPVTEKIVGR